MMFMKTAPLILTACLWGLTNPLIKKSVEHVDKTKTKDISQLKQSVYEWKYLLTNINFIIPFGLNQLGSVLYFFSLQYIDVSIAVPITNSLTFIFNALMGIIIGERKPSKKTFLGMMLVLLGTFIICYDRYISKTK